MTNLLKTLFFRKNCLKLPCSFNSRIPESFAVFYLINIGCSFRKLPSTPFSTLLVPNSLSVSRIK